MSSLDWLVLFGTLGFIVVYGIWRTRSDNSQDNYLRGGSSNRWWGVGLSVMATQASAVTFLSTPGQGYLDGMGFVQFYFGLPLAMLVIGGVFIPLYYKWKVLTAYEFIGKRFDGRTRLLTASLFLIHRSLGAGITIYAPSIVLSQVLDWSLSMTCSFIGALVIIYTTTGGARAVGVTQKQQMGVIFVGLLAAFFLTLHSLSSTVGVGESFRMADAMGKLNVIDLSWDPSNKYTLWSGLIGGFFLQLSYFGTDQSQVQRYLSGQSIAQARRGLWMNGILKIPMQFFILGTGVLVFVFYLVNPAPLHWNEANLVEMRASEAGEVTRALETEHEALMQERSRVALEVTSAWRADDSAAAEGALAQLGTLDADRKALEDQFKGYVAETRPSLETNDKDYIFISFIMQHLPIGVIGLLLAMIFCAGMGSTAAELSALATTTVVDVARGAHDGAATVRSTRWATVGFGLLALGSTFVFSLFENLIQAVNILGSLFYGTILGIFLVAFFLKKVQGTAVFIAALVAQGTILLLHFSEVEVAFLWYNLIAPTIVLVLAWLIQSIRGPSSGSLGSPPAPTAS